MLWIAAFEPIGQPVAVIRNSKIQTSLTFIRILTCIHTIYYIDTDFSFINLIMKNTMLLKVSVPKAA